MGGKLWKLIGIGVILLTAVGVGIWWLERWTRWPIENTIPDPRSLTPTETERLTDMPDHIVTLNSTDDLFLRWLRRDDLPGVPRSDEPGSIIWRRGVQPSDVSPRRE